MELRPDRLERQLAGEPLRPVYLVAGAEPLLVQEAADAIRAKAREEGYGEREVYDAEGSFNWNTLGQGMASLSLFASRRLFDLRLPTGKPGKDGSEALREYCDNPPPDTVLLITAQDWSRAHAGKWSEAIARVGHLVAVWPLKPHELGDWLERRLRSRGLVATPDAVQRLADRVEGNLLAAAQEVDKLALLVGAARGTRSEAIDAAQMEKLVADSSRFDVFKLVDAALAGDSVRAVRMLSALRAEGDQVAGLMPMVAREVLGLCSLSRAVADGGNVASAMREARIWDSKQPIYRRALERHPAPRWEAFAAECGRIDRAAKGRGDGDPWLLLERLLVAIADGRARKLLAS
ncbi:DNA polymerase III subunit delta [Arenimonas sp. MALMAid1274]|uniref:DNA polymerase III subunit delta n=1 Tax=Arenimonas sp. MALMAid1274 TaxID=3411630 RepID=UPI003B9E8410